MDKALRRLTIILASVLLMGAQQGMMPIIMSTQPGGIPPVPPVLVQSKSATGGGITFTSNNTAGNTIVVYYCFGTGTTPNLSDTRGNTYTRYEQQNNAILMGYFVATSIAAGANTVSINTLGAGGVYIAMEFSGVTGIETSQPNLNVSSNPAPLTVGPITITNNNTLVLLYGASQSAGTGTFSNTGSWPAIMNGGFGGLVNTGLFSFAPGLGSTSNTVQDTATSSNKFAGMLGLKG